MKSVEAATAALARRKVAFAIRDPGIRLSPHAHNSEEDIARALEALGRCGQRPRHAAGWSLLNRQRLRERVLRWTGASG